MAWAGGKNFNDIETQQIDGINEIFMIKRERLKKFSRDRNQRMSKVIIHESRLEGQQKESTWSVTTNLETVKESNS